MPAHVGVTRQYLSLSLSHLKLGEILWGIMLEAAGRLRLQVTLLSKKSYIPLLAWDRLSPRTMEISTSVSRLFKHEEPVKKDTKKYFPSKKRSSTAFLGFLSLKVAETSLNAQIPAQVTDKVFSNLNYRLK